VRCWTDDLLYEIDDPTAQLHVGNPHECFGQGQSYASMLYVLRDHIDLVRAGLQKGADKAAE
jgi:hypothetical protein